MPRDAVACDDPESLLVRVATGRSRCRPTVVELIADENTRVSVASDVNRSPRNAISAVIHSRLSVRRSSFSPAYSKPSTAKSFATSVTYNRCGGAL